MEIDRRCLCGHLLLLHRATPAVEFNEYRPAIGSCLNYNCHCSVPDWDGVERMYEPGMNASWRGGAYKRANGV